MSKYAPTRLKKTNRLARLRSGPWPQDPRYDRHRLAWCIGLLILSTLAFEFISVYWTARRYTGLLATMPSYPLVLLLNFLPLALLTAILYALTGRVGLSAGIPGVVLLVLTLINSFKINLRGDPFLFSDIFLAGEAGDMLSSRYSLVFSKSQIAGIIAAVLGLILLSLIAGKIRLHGHWIIRGCTAGGCAVVLLLLILFVYPSNSLYKTTYAGGDLVSSRNAAQWYAAHGFTWSFLHSAVDEDDVSALFSFGSGDGDADLPAETEASSDAGEEEDADTPEESEGDSSAAEETAAESSETESEAVLPSIIMIQLEAYCDVTDYLDSDAVESVYAGLHAIEAESVTGRLLVNCNGGSTQNTERSVITGFTSLPDFSTETNSYAWYLRSLGYTAEGSHPNTGTFYDRETINANLGFTSYYFSENLYESLLDVDASAVSSDDILFDEIVLLMEQSLADTEAENGERTPYFSFNISIQNHGPYSYGTPATEYLTAEDCEDTTIRNIVNNYLELISTTNEALVELVETLRDMDEPVVLVFFGDHMPYWGNYTTLDPYEALGINVDTATDEGFMNYYSTPYVIWANDAAKEALGEDFTGDGGNFGPYFLMNRVFELCGIEGNALTQAANDLMDAGVTMISSAVEVYCENGEFVDSLSEEGQAALDTFLNFQSAWQSSFQYGDLLTGDSDG